MDAPASKQELAYQYIRERILSGAYSPGYRLVISQLAQELGLSAIPVREAIRRLEAAGLVHYQRNSGAVVAPVNEAAYVETMQVLALLEGAATVAAQPHLSAGDCQTMRQINAEMAAALAQVDLIRFSQLNRQFHAVVYARCPNRYLTENIEAAWQRLDLLRRTVFALIPGRARDSLAEHEAIVQALEQGEQPETLERLARSHKLNMIRAFEAWSRHSPEALAGLQR